MTCLYDGFDIESFEAGKGLWHARIRRAGCRLGGLDRRDDIAFAALDVGFAWSDQEAAIADAKSHIDRFGLRSQAVSNGASHVVY